MVELRSLLGLATDLNSISGGIWPKVWCSPVSCAASVETVALVFLSNEERERAARFRFAADRNAFILAHALLRRVLSQLLQADPQDLPLSVSATGKPFVLGSCPYRFNISHCREAVALVISNSAEVGIDVEAVPAGIDTSVLTQAMHPTEIAALHDCSAEMRSKMFCRIWTAKEALLKAAGMGLRMPPAEIIISSVIVAPDEPIRTSQIIDGRHFAIREITDGPEQIALAVAMEGEMGELEMIWIAAD